MEGASVEHKQLCGKVGPTGQLVYLTFSRANYQLCKAPSFLKGDVATLYNINVLDCLPSHTYIKCYFTVQEKNLLILKIRKCCRYFACRAAATVGETGNHQSGTVCGLQFQFRSLFCTLLLVQWTIWNKIVNSPVICCCAYQSIFQKKTK